MRKEEEAEGQTFVEAEQLGTQQDSISFKEIVLKLLQRITVLASKEFRGGFWAEKPLIMGSITTVTKTWVEDSREAYSNAVDNLYDLLLPYADKELLKAEEDTNKELDQAHKNSFYKTDRGKEEFDTQAYRNEKVEVKRKLFREVSKFLHRIKYLESKKYEG